MHRVDARQKIIEEFRRFIAGYRWIVDIPSEEKPIDFFFFGQIQSLIENETLILKQWKLFKALADMKVTQMQEFHPSSSSKNPGLILVFLEPSNKGFLKISDEVVLFEASLSLSRHFSTSKETMRR